MDIVFDPAGERLATTNGGTARVWDAASGTELATLAGHDDVVIAAQRGQTLGSDETVRPRDAGTGMKLLNGHGHDD